MSRSWFISSSPPSATDMHQWIGSALVQIMACRLFGAKPLSKPMLIFLSIRPLEANFSDFFYQNTELSIHKNAFEYNVCEMAAILSRGMSEMTHLAAIQMKSFHDTLHSYLWRYISDKNTWIYIYIYIWHMPPFGNQLTWQNRFRTDSAILSSSFCEPYNIKL